MFERQQERLLPRPLYIRRLARNGLFAFGAIVVALAIGVLGYHLLGHLGWIDSLLNASMILGGMGPVDPLKNDTAKIFASFYALFSGLIFIGIAALLFAPVVHRFMHRFHLQDDDDKPTASTKRK